MAKKNLKISLKIDKRFWRLYVVYQDGLTGRVEYLVADGTYLKLRYAEKRRLEINTDMSVTGARRICNDMAVMKEIEESPPILTKEEEDEIRFMLEITSRERHRRRQPRRGEGRKH